MTAHKPPKQHKKKPQSTAKEKKATKRQKKHQGEPDPLTLH